VGASVMVLEYGRIKRPGERQPLYARGRRRPSPGEFLDAEELLEILDVFGEDGLRFYLMGHVEGVESALEDAEEE
jgi:hypothetical protein